MFDKEYHIRSELLRSGTHFRESRTNFKIRCFDPSCDGADHKTHPYKLEITKDGSKAHCWRCDWSGSWNSLAPKLGLVPFSKGKDKEKFPDADVAKFVKKHVESSLNFDKEPSLPENIEVWDGITGNGEAWRGLRVDFLSLLPIYLWHQVDQFGNRVERILFPFYQWGKLVGYTGRRLDDIKILPYDNADFMSAKRVLFPFDYVRNHFADVSKMVLVEGPVDALVLNQYGIPALSILGVSNWSQCKLDVLITLGVRKVITLMDGDKAGRDGAITIINGVDKNNRKIVRLDTVMDKVKNIELTDGLDPATLDENQLKWLKNVVDIF